MEDIEAFSLSYRTRLDEAEAAKSVPENLSLEVMAYVRNDLLHSSFILRAFDGWVYLVPVFNCIFRLKTRELWLYWSSLHDLA